MNALAAERFTTLEFAAVDPFQRAFTEAMELQQARRFVEAEAIYRRLADERPDDVHTNNNLGAVLFAQGKHQAAIERYDQAIKTDPTFSPAYNNKGAALGASKRHEEALECFKQAVGVAPNDVHALRNYGQLCVLLERFVEAEPPLRQALDIDPSRPDVMVNLAGTLWALRRYSEAEAMFLHTIAAFPDHPVAHKNLGVVRLQQERYAEAWPDYEWRWQADKLPLRHTHIPTWNGDDLTGGALLVWAEQGIGDEILQASMMRDLIDRGINVVLECDSRLAALFLRSFPVMRVIARFSLVPTDVVAQIPAGSLGQHLRQKADDFPANISYLRAHGGRSAMLRERLGLKSGERLVGISWLSKGSKFGPGKSSALIDWLPVLKTPGCRFVDLQYGDTTAERIQMAVLGVHIDHFDDLDLLRDLDGVAALITACDLVITVSSTTAHMAAALGRPTQVLVSASIGHLWYWGEKGSASRWYPMATLIRQRLGQSWASVLQNVAKRLRHSGATT